MTQRMQDFAVDIVHDSDVACGVLHKRFNVDLIVPKSDDVLITSRFIQLPSFSIWSASNTGPASVPIKSSVTTHVHMILRGSCQVTIGGRRFEAGAGEAFVCSSGKPALLDYQSDHEELVLLIPPDVLNRVFASLTGFQPKSAIEFEPVLDTANPRHRGFRDLVMMLVGRLDPANSAWPEATLEQLEQACLTSLLFCSRHNMSRVLDPMPCAADVPRHVRIAEHFAEMNADRDIGIDQMAAAAAVSVSTLTRAFLKYRGCTPASFIKRTRLTRARELLESGAATTVVGVALRCGFSNPSRFGKDYERLFGETPTQTLRRLREQPLGM